MDSITVSIALAVGAGHFVIWVALRLLSQGKPRDRVWRYGEREQTYPGVDGYLGTTFIVAYPVSIAAWWWLLASVSQWHISRIQNGVYAIPMRADFWLLPAYCLGSLSACLLVDVMQRILLRNQFADYEYHGQQKSEVNIALLTGVMHLVFGGIAGLLVLESLDEYVVIRSDAIILNRPFSLAEERYDYDEVAWIRMGHEHATWHDGIVAGRLYTVTFANGRAWCTQYAPADVGDAKWSEMMAFISAQSGRPIQQQIVLELADIRGPTGW